MAAAIKVERWRLNLFRRVTMLAQYHARYGVVLRFSDIAGLLDEAGETFECLAESFRYLWGIDVFKTAVEGELPGYGVAFQQYGVSGHPMHVETLAERSRWR